MRKKSVTSRKKNAAPAQRDGQPSPEALARIDAVVAEMSAGRRSGPRITDEYAGFTRRAEETVQSDEFRTFIRDAMQEANAFQRGGGTTRDAMSRDSYQNMLAQLGIGTNNLSTASSYGFNPITRVRTLLEWMYRGSWIVGKAVDSIAEDMTKKGVSWLGEIKPEDQDKLNRAIQRHAFWKRMQQGHKWGRLYGGAIVVMVIDGQRLDTPLRIDTVRKGQFRGFVVLDRWMINPTFTQIVADAASPDQGFPEWYDVVTYAPPSVMGKRIHHSRCFRMIGVELPYWQMVWENYWGMSVLERLYDRLVAFDSSTQGAAQLMYRAYLRTLSVANLRKIVATGGPAYDGLIKQVQMMRAMQSNEGVTLIDGEDKFETSSYSFAGVGETILQMGQQLSGAIDTPLVRLFGQSPAGLNSTGESDMRIYYDGINQRQETDTRDQCDRGFRVIAASEEIDLDDSFGFSYNPLWQLTDQQKSEIGQRNTQTILEVEQAGLVSPQVILRELKQQSATTGVWTNITDEDIEAAEDEPPPSPQEMMEQGGEGGQLGPPRQERDPVDQGDRRMERADSRDELPLREVAGLPVVIETPRGSRRMGPGWSVIMPADYGYFRGTQGADGEQVDCLVGQDVADVAECWVVDMVNPATGLFDEHKVLIGFPDATEATAHLRAAYSDYGKRRVGAVTRMSLDQLREWLSGVCDEPLRQLRVVS